MTPGQLGDLADRVRVTWANFWFFARNPRIYRRVRLYDRGIGSVDA